MWWERHWECWKDSQVFSFSDSIVPSIDRRWEMKQILMEKIWIQVFCFVFCGLPSQGIWMDSVFYVLSVSCLWHIMDCIFFAIWDTGLEFRRVGFRCYRYKWLLKHWDWEKLLGKYAQREEGQSLKEWLKRWD